MLMSPYSIHLSRLYAVIVIRVTADLDTNTMNYDNVHEFMGNNDEPYVAAAWDNAQNVPDTFEIGTGTTTVADGVTYRNVPLQSNSRYAAVVRVEIVSDDPTMVSNYLSVNVVYMYLQLNSAFHIYK